MSMLHSRPSMRRELEAALGDFDRRLVETAYDAVIPIRIDSMLIACSRYNVTANDTHAAILELASKREKRQIELYAVAVRI